MLGALALDGFRGFMTIDAGTSTDVFEAFVTHELVPNLRAQDIVVMDNLSAHKNAAIRTSIEAAGCELVFTPPYSPEFNPIEEAWAKLKDLIRRATTTTRVAFDQAVANAMDQVRTAISADGSTTLGTSSMQGEGDLEIQYEQTGGDETISIPGSEAPIEVVSARMTATGRAVLDLNSLISSGSLRGFVRDVLVVSEEGKDKSALVEEVFEVEVKR